MGFQWGDTPALTGTTEDTQECNRPLVLDVCYRLYI